MSNLLQLNKEQRDAVQNQSQYILVLAGPGSGKTTVLVERLKYEIEVLKKKSESFLIITFTKAAVISMEQRFHKATNSKYPNTTFTTFHALFYQILAHAGILNSKSFLTKKEQEQILNHILEMLPNKNYYKNHDSIYLLSQIKQSNPTKLTEEEAIVIQTMKELYQKEKEKRKKYEYDDMAPLCISLLKKNKEILNYWKARFSSIYIDEFQDINMEQYEVISLLAKEENQLMVVGDDDQSIYGFRGANPNIITTFLEDYTSAYQIILGKNYRSNRTLVHISKDVIEENKNRIAKDLEGCIEATELAYGIHSNELECEEYNRAANMIIKYQGTDEKEIAIIARTNFQLQKIKEELNRREISCHIFSKQKKIEDSFIIDEIKNILEIIYFYHNKKVSRKMWLKLFHMLQLDVSRDILDKEETFLEELGISAIADKLERQQLQQLHRDFDMIYGKSVFLTINFIRKKMKYDSVLKKRALEMREHYYEYEKILDYLQMVGKKYPNYEDFMLYLDSELEQFTIQKEITNIILLTMHMAKGLEFERVFILDCNWGVIPPGKNLTDEEIEEERRLFYVAITRAKKTLDLFYLSGTKENPRLPSIFLKTML